ncbi:MAG: hypothetical protein JWO90_2631, partial [Solirubrobacterales bacterium]|nr:hypothetical protein [Solirubrobacterales bacterium]
AVARAARRAERERAKLRAAEKEEAR